MARIQSSVGIVSGIPIKDTVDQLVALQGLARDRLVSRNKVLGAQQAALTDLTALTLGVQFAIRRLKTTDLFGQRTVTSSRPELLTATASAAAPPGQYQFVPARLAQAHQTLSTGLAARDQALGGGTLSVRLGGHINPGASLADLNGGLGVARGKIKITDRSGESAIIDLRFAQTIDDVLTAINQSDDISIAASAAGDRIVLQDSSGGSGNLRVEESADGSTAADLGLGGINVAVSEATGQDLVRLFPEFGLQQLRDGSGLSLRSELPELSINFRDGTSLDVDLDPPDTQSTTLGDLLDQLNAADPARLQASISADGKRIVLADLTTGSDSFTVASALGGSVAEELGIAGSDAGGTISGQRLIGGLKTTLLGSLSGGQGLGTLGLLELTDRSGASATVNLATAETLDDVIESINAANVGISAAYNSARNGLVLTDTTGATSSNLIAADGDASETATKLGLNTSVAAAALNSGSLHRQVVSRNAALATYKNGGAISQGSFLIRDSSGSQGAVNLKVLEPQTIGDVLDAINALSIGVEARLNDQGDGILLVDTAGGSGTLTVSDVSGKSAADLRLTGNGQSATIDGQPAQVIDGTTTLQIELEADDTLDDLVTKLNAAGGGVTAAVLSDPSAARRHHLSLLSSISGKAGELLIDGAGLGLTFNELAAAQDAVLQVGSSSAGGHVVSGATNSFQEVLPGLNVNLQSAATETVTVNVAQTVSSVSGAIQTFVDNYNKLRAKLEVYTAYDPAAGTKGTLFASAETLRVDADLSRLVTGRFLNDGSVHSLGELGISINDQGDLAFDKTKLEARFAADPDSVIEFFTDETRGFAIKADGVLEGLVGANSSLLVNRAKTLQTQIESYVERIDVWNARLERNRQSLFLEFTRLEEVISRVQNNLTAIQQIQYIGPIQSSSSG